MVKLLIGGSPCTYWSVAQKKNRETEAEGLGWELFKNYLIAKEKFKPDFFLYENNKSASQAIRDQISHELGVDLMYINSALVSAQNRQRFYAFNWDVEQPADRGILLKDILESGVPFRNEKSYCIDANYYKGGNMTSFNKQSGQRLQVAEPVNTATDGKDRTLKAQYFRNGIANFVTNGGFSATAVAEPIRVGTLPNSKGEMKDAQATRIYSIDGKSVNLVANGGGQGAKTGLYDLPVEKEVGFAIAVEWNENGEPIIAISGTDEKTYPVYKVENGFITIKDTQYQIKLADGYYIIRKLSIKECCRLQTMPEIIHNVKIDLKRGEISCLDRQKISVPSAEEKCHRSQEFAKDAHAIDLNEFARFVEKGLSIKLPQTNELVPLNVHTNLEGLNSQKDCSRGSLKNANNAEKNLKTLNADQTEIFAQAIVGMSTILRKTMQIGKEELHLNGKPFAVLKNGKVQFMKCGTEIMQLVEDAEINISKVKKAIASTTSEALPDTKNLEQTLTTLCYYVLNAIGGYILQQTNGEILFSIKTPYTYAVSNTQAYKGLGNGWTAEVIIHILNGALKDVPKDEEIIVLSMYDGIGTGRYCLSKMGFTNIKYYAYEIDKYAKQIAMSNYPDIVQMGDAFDLRNENWSLNLPLK